MFIHKKCRNLGRLPIINKSPKKAKEPIVVAEAEKEIKKTKKSRKEVVIENNVVEEKTEQI